MLAAVGLLLPFSPPGPPLGLLGLPGPYHALVAAVLGLHGVSSPSSGGEVPARARPGQP